MRKKKDRSASWKETGRQGSGNLAATTAIETTMTTGTIERTMENTKAGTKSRKTKTGRKEKKTETGIATDQDE